MHGFDRGGCRCRLVSNHSGGIPGCETESHFSSHPAFNFRAIKSLPQSLAFIVVDAAAVSPRFRWRRSGVRVRCPAVSSRTPPSISAQRRDLRRSGKAIKSLGPRSKPRRGMLHSGWMLLPLGQHGGGVRGVRDTAPSTRTPPISFADVPGSTPLGGQAIQITLAPGGPSRRSGVIRSGWMPLPLLLGSSRWRRSGCETSWQAILAPHLFLSWSQLNLKRRHLTRYCRGGCRCRLASSCGGGVLGCEVS